MKEDFLFTSESVTIGHPDKLCDVIADAVVDRYLRQDSMSRVITECAVANGILFVAARFASQASVDIPDLARQIIQQVGYNRDNFNADNCTVMTSLSALPSREGRDEREMSEAELERVPARQMANVFGFACNQTQAMLPLPIWLAHKLARRLAAARLSRRLIYLGPDASTQVAVEYRQARPHRIHSITLVASQWRDYDVNPSELAEGLLEEVVQPCFLDESIKPDERTHYYINPDGPFIEGGPTIHSGLTGRKNAIDTYGEYSRQSGSALSGKDPGRIDRVGAYAARYAAKNVVASGLAGACEVQLSYSIGQARPVSVRVQTDGSGRIPDVEIAKRVAATFDFRPAGIIRAFNLRHQPSLHRGGFYHRLAAYGHVGRMDMSLPWERTDKCEQLV